MSNPSKEKGTHGETEVVRYMNSHGLKAERVPLAGSEDKGDIRITMPTGWQMIGEVKSGSQTANPSRGQMEKWKAETLRESENACLPAVLVIRRYRRKADDIEIWRPLRRRNTQWMMSYIDEFCKEFADAKEES